MTIARAMDGGGTAADSASRPARDVGAEPTAHGQPPIEPGVAEAPLDWTLNPWRERARTAVAATVSALLVSLVAVTSQLPPLAMLALALAGVAAMAPSFAITRCRVDEHGVARRLGGLWWERRPWDRIRLVQWTRRGVLVSPERRPGAWAALRGMFLPLPIGEDALVLREELRARIGRRGL